jgi:hypothetical protein
MQEFDLSVDGFRRIKIYKISLKVGIVLLLLFWLFWKCMFSNTNLIKVVVNMIYIFRR